MQTLELCGLQELSHNELMNIDGGDGGIKKFFQKLCEKAIKITDNGTLLDGIPGNTDIDFYLFGIKIF